MTSTAALAFRAFPPEDIRSREFLNGPQAMSTRHAPFNLNVEEFSPDIMVSNLENFIRGIMQASDKDRALLGATRIYRLWTGHIESHRRSRRGISIRSRVASKDDMLVTSGNESAGGDGRSGTLLRGVTGRAEGALRRGFDFVT